MSVFIGYLAAVIANLSWGSCMVPMKRMKSYDPFSFQAIICFSIFASSIAITLVTQSWNFSPLAIISGILWVTASLLSLLTLKKVDMSVAIPIWNGIGIATSFIWALAYFGEKITILQLAIVGLLLLILGILIISLTGKYNKSTNLSGLLLILSTGLLIGTYIVPFRLAQLSPVSFLFPMSVGVFISGLLLLAVRRPKIERKIIAPAALSGALWNIANFASFFVVSNLGLAIGYPLTQLSFFISILWGVLYFHEIKGKKTFLQLIFGSIILFLGVVLLSFSK